MSNNPNLDKLLSEGYILTARTGDPENNDGYFKVEKVMPDGSIQIEEEWTSVGDMSWTVPRYVESIEYCIIGGGGSGARKGSSPSDFDWNVGGGHGGAFTSSSYTVSEGQVLTGTVGAGGTPGNEGGNGNAGSSTTFIASVIGGAGGDVGHGADDTTGYKGNGGSRDTCAGTYNDGTKYTDTGYNNEFWGGQAGFANGGTFDGSGASRGSGGAGGSGGYAGGNGVIQINYTPYPVELPSPITDLQASEGNLDITVTWTNSTGDPVPQQDIYRDGALLASNVSSPYVDTSVEAGNTYSYHVVAHNRFGDSITSNTDTGMAGTNMYLGDGNVLGAYLGDLEVKAIYLGNIEIFNKG